MSDFSYPSISILVPAYNEESGIAGQVRAIQNVMQEMRIQHEIIVIDDGSEDQTAEQALSTGVRLIQHLTNRGYGAAIKTGIQAATYETIVILDADGTYPADQIPVLIEKMEHADMVVGSRTGESVDTNKLRQPAKWFLRMLAARLAEQPIPDLNSGLRAFRKDCIKQYFPILSNRFSFTTTSTLAYLGDGYQIVYHPINYYPRVGKSKIVPWHFMDFTILILRLSMMFNPLKVYVPLAFFFGGLGILKVVFDLVAVFLRNPGLGWSVLLQPVLSTSAVLLLFVGLQFMMIGMVADGVVRRIAQANRPLVPSRGTLIRNPPSPVHSSTPTGEEPQRFDA
jgi:glycosyltransferase involved in cell wall biosynthesis